jgi:hypothetical protein
MNNAKSMLGGSLEQKARDDRDNFPGPGTYPEYPASFPAPEGPGFRIEVPKGKSLKQEDKSKEPVGP